MLLKFASGSNPIQFSSANAGKPVGHALHPMRGAVMKPSQAKGTVVPLLQGCVVAALALIHWLGLGLV